MGMQHFVGQMAARFAEEVLVELLDCRVLMALAHGLAGIIRIESGCTHGTEIHKVAHLCRVNVDDVPEIVEEHLLKGRVVKRLLYQETVQEDTVKSLDQTDFYKKQMRVALKNCGVIDPENINEYIAYDGYAALGKVLTEMTPEEVIKTVKDSGSRTRLRDR